MTGSPASCGAFADIPSAAAWQHRVARRGFEVAFFEPTPKGLVIRGHTVAVEAGVGWSVDYVILVDSDWRTATAGVRGQTRQGEQRLQLATDGKGRWMVDGVADPQLDGCLDVDLESSAVTNALPVHRMRLSVGEQASAPAAYVLASDLTVQRLEQRYARLPGDARFSYAAPAFNFSCDLTYDGDGLVRDYPGIATRVL